LDACFVVRDRNGQQLAYVYFEEEPGRGDSGHYISARERPTGPQQGLLARYPTGSLGFENGRRTNVRKLASKSLANALKQRPALP
jgi:hypothetical protein